MENNIENRLSCSANKLRFREILDSLNPIHIDEYKVFSSTFFFIHKYKELITKDPSNPVENQFSVLNGQLLFKPKITLQGDFVVVLVTTVRLYVHSNTLVKRNHLIVYEKEEEGLDVTTYS